MKTSTSVQLLFAVFTIIGLSASAQPRNGGNDPRGGNHQSQNQGSTNTTWASGNTNSDSKRGGHVNININGGGYYGGGYYGSGYYYGNGYNYNNYYGYNSGYNIKRAARNSIHQSAGFIGQALQFTEWNDIYSPWLAKAIRHQQYARDLYFWGDYAGALNHAERAGFLAWNTLSYFNGGYGYGTNNYGGGSYPNPYGDPNNPYYRQNNSGNQPSMQDMPSDNGYGYSERKSSGQNPGDNSTYQEQNTGMRSAQKIEATQLDGTLPQNKVSDRELLKMSAKDLDIE